MAEWSLITMACFLSKRSILERLTWRNTLLVERSISTLILCRRLRLSWCHITSRLPPEAEGSLEGALLWTRPLWVSAVPPAGRHLLHPPSLAKLITGTTVWPKLFTQSPQTGVATSGLSFFALAETCLQLCSSISHTPTHTFLTQMLPVPSLVASEVPCPTLFPAGYRNQQGWMAVTPKINQAPTPLLLPTQPPCQLIRR